MRALMITAPGEVAVHDVDPPVAAPGEVVESVSGADMLDGVGPAASDMVPAHGIAVVR